MSSSPAFQLLDRQRNCGLTPHRKEIGNAATACDFWGALTFDNLDPNQRRPFPETSR